MDRSLWVPRDLNERGMSGLQQSTVWDELLIVIVDEVKVECTRWTHGISDHRNTLGIHNYWSWRSTVQR